MKHSLVILMLIFSAAPARADWKYHPVVREINRTYFRWEKGAQSMLSRTDYCLYLGDSETLTVDATLTEAPANLSLVHPTPGVARSMSLKARARWYASFTNTDPAATSLAPLLVEDVWRTIPTPMQHILVALGRDDPELILISKNLQSGSISVFFHPSHDADREFYKAKLEILDQYIEGHDLETAVPLEQVVQAESAEGAPTRVPVLRADARGRVLPERDAMAVKIPADIQEFMKGKQGWVATASKDGIPNVSIKGTLRLLDDEHLIFADLFSLKTRKNLGENPNVAIMVYDGELRRGYAFKGSTEQIDSGPLYDQTVEAIRKQMPQLPTPKYIVRVTVSSIYDQSIGPTGGAKIA